MKCPIKPFEGLCWYIEIQLSLLNFFLMLYHIHLTRYKLFQSGGFKTTHIDCVKLRQNLTYKVINRPGVAGAVLQTAS